MVMVKVSRGIACLLCGLFAFGFSSRVQPQIAPRLTGDAVLSRLDVARRALSTRADKLHDSRLEVASQRLEQISDALRKMLAGHAATAVDLMDEQARAAVLRGDAAVQRTQAYLDVADGCVADDAEAIAGALELTIDQLANATGSAKMPPVIDAVETMDHRPLFAIHANGKPLAFALAGANLSDQQCADPQITATDDKGVLLDAQPVVTGAMPTRIELTLPAGSKLKPGSYVVHVVPKRKIFLRGCTAQPEAIAVLQMAPPLRYSVSYVLTAICGAANGQGVATGRPMPLATGKMPDITAHGMAVSKRIDTAACAEPVSYAISATTDLGDGNQVSVGPMTQAADASMTTGLPGGISLRWNPSVGELVVRSGGNLCKGVD
jgi:hypothetical protein